MYQVDVYLRVRRGVMVEVMSVREASRVFSLHRDTVRKMLAYSVPPPQAGTLHRHHRPYRGKRPPGSPGSSATLPSASLSGSG